MIAIFVAFVTDNIHKLMILYLAVMLHETGHFIACIILKEKVLKLRFMLYGANLCTENIVNPVHSVIVSASGPLVSLALVCFFGMGKGEFYSIFKASNIAVFVLNVFPALPLDGGVFLKSALCYKMGYVKSHKIAIDITRITAFVFAFFGFIFLILSKYNISLLVISAFLLYNLKVERKKIIFLRQMIYSKEIDRKVDSLNVKELAVMENAKAICLTDYFGYNYICRFSVYDINMNFLGLLEQSQVVDGIINSGADVHIGRLLGGTNEYKRCGIQNIT